MRRSLTQEPDLFSTEAWDLLLKGEEVAQRWRHENLDVEHLLQVLFTDKSYIKFIEALEINHSILIENLEDFLSDLPIKQGTSLFIGEDLEELLESADNFRTNWGSKLIDISHLLIALGRDPRIGAQLFEDSGLPSELLEAQLRNLPRPSSFNRENQKITEKQSNFSEISNLKESSEINNKSEVINSIEKKDSIRSSFANTSELKLVKEPSPIEAFAKDLTETAQLGKLDPVIGRDEEIQRVIKVLSRREKNNPVLIGSAGVGKTAIAELLAQRIVNGEVPDSLMDVKLVSLDIGALIAGTKFRGEFEERLRSVLSEASNPEGRMILFIDELHNILNTDRSIADAGSLLKPVLASGDLRCIGTTTPEDYRRTIEKDQALNRRFQQVPIKEPSLECSLEILKGVKGRYEIHHGVSISDQAVVTANLLANRYINDRCLPDKAIDLIDEAAAQLKIDTTSKPKIIEKAEKELKKLELLLIKTDKNISAEEIQSIKLEKTQSYKKLEDLNHQWQKELSTFNELRELIQEIKSIQSLISKAEEIGDLEEASRLKYNDLNNLNNRKNKVEEIQFQSKISGKALIRDQVEAEDIADVVAKWTGIPVNKVLAEERQKLLDLEKDLGAKVIGQPEAIQAISAAIRRARAGMKDSRRPVGSFMFLGPTGVGKTELAKTLAAYLFDEKEALVRLDMSEFMEKNAVARLLGAPPGYVGYEEGGQLTEAVRQRPYAVLLLDEIEKAHSEVFNILLQVLDDGRLTDSKGRTVDFRHTVIVMTSNLASKDILEYSRKRSKENDKAEFLKLNLLSKIDEALTKQFRPEFLNRIDEVIRFNPLDEKDLIKIINIYLNELKSLLAEQDLELIVDEKAKEILASDGFVPEYGARPLRRVLRRRLENPLATELLAENFLGAKAIQVKAPEEGSNYLRFIAIS
tara:strand:- start:73418 stop:76183 length:2766 start_codon:yes stop_codon:yes gene_type:complete